MGYAGRRYSALQPDFAPTYPNSPASRTDSAPNSVPTTSEKKMLMTTAVHDIDSSPPNAPVPAASGLSVIAEVSAATVCGPLPSGTKLSSPVAIHQKKTEA